MAETTRTQSQRDTQVKVVVPDEYTMVGLLGSGDLIEKDETRIYNVGYLYIKDIL